VPAVLSRKAKGLRLLLGLVAGILAGAMFFSLGRTAPATNDGGSPLGQGDTLRAVTEGGVAMEFLIDGVRVDTRDADGELQLYEIRSRRDENAPWENYCMPDPDGVSRALVVAGSWDERGTFREAPGLVTFACTNGAIGKCLRWGYKPWKQVGGMSLKRHHLACVRLVRGDYCGDGRHHTKDGTVIDVFDALGIQKPEPTSDARPEVFEAAWSPEGATYVNVPRWADDVASLVRECPERLRGRTSADRQLAVEDVGRAFPESLIFNRRMLRDADKLGAR
jgi:hypothetical protein